jgi:hypothetical protein
MIVQVKYSLKNNKIKLINGFFSSNGITNKGELVESHLKAIKRTQIRNLCVIQQNTKKHQINFIFFVHFII